MKAILLVLLLLYGVNTLELSTQHPLVTPNNASETFLVCPPAENFIQTHMAPDFETPQLVRRLDWFHDDSLIASYQQNLIDDVSRQWWVADGRYQLIRPFYYLRIAPVQPEDSGTYRCRLETDPLFALTMSTAQVELTVMVRPVAPSSPEIKSSSNRSVTLVWNHNTAEAHRPILRFSVVVRSVIDEEQFIIPAPSNATSVIVDNLSPFTLYTFAVRAENAAGYSEFGPETKFRTLGEAPMNPPHIISIVNTTSSCVSVLVEPPEEMQGDLNGYTVVLQRLNDTEPRREFFPGTPSGRLSLCHLVPHSSYAIAIEVDNGFGPSPPARTIFITDETVPKWAPSNIRIVPSVGKASLTVHWNTPNISNEIITHYNLYYKAHGQNKWKMNLLNDRKKNQITHKYELKGLAHSTTYSIRISASTSKGEGEGSKTQNATTDVAVPVPTEISNITFDCKDGVHLHWHSHHSERAHYHVEMKNRTRKLLFNTTINKLDVVDLSHYEEYAVRVSCSIRSLVDQSILNGPWGEEQRFMLNDQCSYQSSLCSPNSKCLRLVQSSGPLRLPYLVAILALILFIILCFIVAYSLKGHCLDMKMLLKKKKEKCVYLEELNPLVYDSTTCDDIPVELFYGYCEDLSRNENCKYRLQFEQIERITSGDSAEADMLEKNLDKNRYLNIGAMEATRIRISSSAGSDYINANYIDSCEKRNAYIATQAPLPSTFADFWAMIWQERCNVVVVITNMVEDGRRKCDQYWPSCIQSPQTHGTYQVGLVAETTNAHFIHRILSLRIAKCVPPMERRVHQLHFTGWPDHGVPDTVFPLLTFMNFVSDIHSTGPIVVHCSAGVGRSGSYILVDSMRRHLINFRRLNVMGHLIHMRRQRQKLVQTLEQYILCHEAIRQLIRHGITRVHSNLFHRYLHYLAEENVNGKTRIQMQYEDLCECKHNPRCVPPNDYIVLPGYHRQDEFIVSNWPTENEEFWQLVWQKNCQTVVLLAEDAYWTGLEQVGEMVIQHGENFALLQNNEDQLCVRIVPVSRTAIEADFWGEIERIQKERLAYHDAPLLVINTGSWLMTPCTNQRMSSTIVHPSVLNETRNSTLSLSLAYNDVPPSLAYALCALTALACQLEQQGCVDVVQVLSSYSHLHCGLWASKQDIEFIYSKLAVLVGSSRV